MNMEGLAAVGFVFTDKENEEAEIEITNQLFTIQKYSQLYNWNVLAVVSSWSTDEGYEELLRILDEVPILMLIVSKPLHSFKYYEELQQRLDEKGICATTINPKRETAITLITS